MMMGRVGWHTILLICVLGVPSVKARRGRRREKEREREEEVK